ncbi:TolC family protein [Gracilimonas mengyeensis]|uniref:Outer membrane protein TolC n=1 Tax=Gracilimonas mengyeensis TaxID=1302730 RepID=A0A521ACU6_9BACT|nr:TolC family protein [Gracilimonas mengyeensis]SMO32591.1 Outer membrane protein TolC [Gracilimonas mengyeensis]
MNRLKSLSQIVTVFLCFGVMVSLPVQAQQTLSLEDAIRLGMEKNFAIRIAENNARIADNNASIGNAGFLPVVTADGSINERIEDNTTVYGSPSIPDRNDEGARTTVYNYGIDATWTLFDGLTMFAAFDRLAAQKEISEVQARQQVELVLADIITGYYEIAGQQKAAAVLDSTVKISEERIRIAESAWDIGSGSEYDLLLARGDYNADRAALIRSQTSLSQLKIVLTSVLGDLPSYDFAVNPEIEMAELLELDALIDDALAQNRQLTIARLTERSAQAEIREVRGEWFPEVSVSGGYGYQRTEASAGFAEFSETDGFSYGVTARLNLFDGLNKNRRMQNAQITAKNEQLRIEELQLQITAEVSRVYAQYLDARSLIELEQENLDINKETVDIALERYRLGTISAIELREAQQSLLDAENRLIDAQIQAKAAETELLRLSGRLLSEEMED